MDRHEGKDGSGIEVAGSVPNQQQSVKGYIPITILEALYTHTISYHHPLVPGNGTLPSIFSVASLKTWDFSAAKQFEQGYHRPSEQTGRSRATPGIE